MIAASADNPDSVTKENIIAASREYRTAVKLISAISLQSSFVGGNTERPKEGLEDYERARRHLKQSIALNPYLPEAYFYLANSYGVIENDLQKTVEYYSRALEIDPDYADVIYSRGNAFISLKRIEDAEKDLRRLEALKSSHAPSLRERIAKLKSGDDAFLKQSKEIPPSREWNREIVCLNDTNVRVLVEGSGALGVTIVSDAARKAILAGDRAALKKIGIHLTEDVDSIFDKTLKLSKGSHWVIIKNQNRESTEVKLSCYNR